MRETMNLNEYSALLDEGEIEIVTNGHRVRTDSCEFRMILMMAVDPVEKMVARLKAGGTQLDPVIEFPIVEEGSWSFQCSSCGKKPTVTIYEDHIEFEANHVEPQAFSVDIEFPSGEMLFNDTYPDCFDSGDFDVNTVAGTQECSENMAKQGIMHFFVGNSCPAVWKEGDTIYVGSLPDDDWDNADGSICTDLWWASFVDPVIVTRRSINAQGLENPDSDPLKEIEHMRKKGGSIKVSPGTYRCTSYYHLGKIDYGSEGKQVFCKLEKV